MAEEIRSARLDDATIRRHGGDGLDFACTWAADDSQLVCVWDGCGWPENPGPSGYFNNALYAARGSEERPLFEPVPGYPPKPIWDFLSGDVPPYYGTGILAIGSHIYQWLATMSHMFEPGVDSSGSNRLIFSGAKLLYSRDRGVTWHNQDGSPPRWEGWDAQSDANLIFRDQDQGAFALLTFVQMGRGYADNRDGYIYVYGLNGCDEGRMNQLVLFRAPIDHILDQGRFEYFSGRTPAGEAIWHADPRARAVVHQFPDGWVGRYPWGVPFAWLPSIVYNAPLGLYLMASWASDGAADKSGASGPSYLGLWTATQPSGPWRQILEERSWCPAGDRGARAYRPQILPRSISRDGRSFTLAWTDLQPSRGFTPEDRERRLQALRDRDQPAFNLERLRWRQFHPYCGLNTQRVELCAEAPGAN